MSLITFLGLAVIAASLMCFYLIRLLGKKEMDHAAEVVDTQKDLDFYKYMSVEIQKHCDTISDGYKKAKTTINHYDLYVDGLKKNHTMTIHQLNNDITKLKRQVKRSRKDANRVISR